MHVPPRSFSVAIIIAVDINDSITQISNWCSPFELARRPPALVPKPAGCNKFPSMRLPNECTNASISDAWHSEEIDVRVPVSLVI